jgi:hypothetical protein
MTIVDKQRVAAVATLEALGYSFSLPAGWSPPAGGASTSTTEADRMHGLLMRRADGSPEKAELASIVNAIEKYEAKRWPDGKEPGAKG